MSKAQGGGGGESAYNSNIVTLDGGTSAADGIAPFIEVIYTSPSTTGGTTVTTNTIVLGSGTDTLTLNSNSVGIQTVRCKVTHPTACNAPANEESIVGSTSNSAIYTKTALYDVISALNAQRSVIKYEIVQDDDSSYFSTIAGETNLYVQNLDFQASSERPYRAICVYAPEENLNIEVTMAGSAGQSFNNNLGGEGGRVVFTYTLQQNTEYMFLLGATEGATSSLGRGGAGAYFYEKGKLLVACGGGGASGWYSGSGGDGGGPGYAGESGSGNGAGQGGSQVSDGQLSSAGVLPNSGSGGKVESCTTGNYWANAGYSPCDDIGQQQFRTNQGTVVSGTATLQRGYKASGTTTGSTYAYRNNGGDSTISVGGAYVCGGGAGAYGGDAGRNANSGAGGGSGYTDGSVTIVSSQQGGNTSSSAYATIKLS